MFSISSCKGNANRKHNKTPLELKRVDENEVKLDPSYITGGNIKWDDSPFGNISAAPLKVKHRVTKSPSNSATPHRLSGALQDCVLTLIPMMLTRY